MIPAGQCPSRIMIVGEFPQSGEELKPFPFSASNGDELGRMLREAGIRMGECFMTYVSFTRPPAGDVGAIIALKKKDITPKHVQVYNHQVLPSLAHDLARLKAEIELCKPNVIIAVGNLPLWALTGEYGIGSWRGSVMDCALWSSPEHTPIVIPTYAPNWLFAQYHLRVVALHDLRQALRYSTVTNFQRTQRNFVIRPSFEVVMNYLSDLKERLEKEKVELSMDLETRAGHIACIGLATDKLNAICIPFMCKERDEGYWTLDEELEIIWEFLQIFRHSNLTKIGQNFLYDSQYIYRWWLMFLPADRDTMIAQHVCFSQMQKGLDFLSSMYCEEHLYWKDDGKEWDYSKPEEEYWDYNCWDAVRTIEADGTLQKNLTTMGLTKQFAFQMRIVPAVLRTMIRGVRCDVAAKINLSKTLEAEIADREAWILDVTGRPLNPKSPKQMVDFFYQEMNQKPVISRDTGNPTCDNDALTKIGKREPVLQPICRRILELRSLGVFLSTFIEAKLDHDLRIRSSYNVAGTETYRFSSSQNAFGSGLNMQNIPKGDEDGDYDPEALVLPNVRKLFLPDPGYTFFDIDLDSADLRIVVWDSDAKEMKAMFAEGKKPYVEVAKEYYHDPSITKNHQAYPVFKALCHGTNYLGQPSGLATRVGLLVHEVERVQKWYYGKFPEIKVWQERIKDTLNKRRMVENVFGFRTYFFGRLEGTIYNQAVAWIPQSTVGILINHAYVNLHENHPDIQVLLQVHDSLAGQYPTHLEESAKKRIIEASQVTLKYESGDLIIPVGIKTSRESWGMCG